MNRQDRESLLAFCWGGGIVLNLLAALGGGGYPGLFVLVGVALLTVALGLVWKGRH